VIGLTADSASACGVIGFSLNNKILHLFRTHPTG
jgi:hypothetical protein